jgi:hypothetical protein
LHRKPVEPVPALLVSLTTGTTPAVQPLDYPHVSRLSLPSSATLKALADLVTGTAQSENDLVCLLSDDLQIDCADWLWEALGLFERFPDTVMVGGRIRNSAGSTVSAGLVLGFGSGSDCPDRNRPALDPGYFTQMMKQRSVSAVSSQFTVLRSATIAQFGKQFPAATVASLGPLVGVWALQTGKRVIYSPYLSGVSNLDWDAQATSADLTPDHRYYPAAFGMLPDQAYRLIG